MATSDMILEMTDDNFADQIQDTDGLTMVDFWATWCGPCRYVEPVVAELAGDYQEKGLRVGKLNVDENPATAARFNVTSIPRIMFFKGGELVDTVIGAVPRPHLEEKILKHL